MLSLLAAALLSAAVALADASVSDVVLSDTGIATVKIPSVGKMLASADGRDLFEPGSHDAQHRLGVPAAEGLHKIEGLHILHIQEIRVGNAQVTVKSGLSLRAVSAVILRKCGAECVELVAAYIQSGSQRVAAEALQMLRAGGKGEKGNGHCNQLVNSFHSFES